MNSPCDADERMIVGVADCRVCCDPGRTLVTYGLGSCIAVAIYDALSSVGGLLHFMLPDSRLDRRKAAQNPYVFADTGVPRLFHEAYAAGAAKPRLSVWIAGGARSREMGADLGDVGKKNILAVKRILWRAGVLIRGEHIGGHEPREVRLELSDGRVVIK